MMMEDKEIEKAKAPEDLRNKDPIGRKMYGGKDDPLGRKMYGGKDDPLGRKMTQMTPAFRFAGSGRQSTGCR